MNTKERNAAVEAIVTFMAEDVARGLGAGAQTSAALNVESATYTAAEVRAMVVGAAVNTCHHFAQAHREVGMSRYPAIAKAQAKRGKRGPA